ncbi:hypothetical protein SVAN01_06653 [Stagonosporopsis vannaccii]|nr:hypothetical protein SVAN01_06653 [Stagonosporopsis vannaccii]
MVSKMYITSPSRIIVLELIADPSTVIFTLALALIVAAGWLFGP